MKKVQHGGCSKGSLFSLVKTITGITPFLLTLSAEAADILGANFSTRSFDFREFQDDGSRFVSETGPVYGGELQWRKQLGSAYSVGLAGTFMRGLVDYDGRTDISNQPHKTTTDEMMMDVNATFGKSFNAWQGGEVATVYAGVGHYMWVRDIQTRNNVVGLFENYAWYYANLGARGRLFHQDKLKVSIDVSIARMFAPTMHVNFKGRFKNTVLNLGEHYGAKLSLAFDYAWRRKWVMNVEPFVQVWDMGRSPQFVIVDQDGFQEGAIHEPRSATQFYGVKLGVWYQYSR
jgi:hypothetical protein